MLLFTTFTSLALFFKVSFTDPGIIPRGQPNRSAHPTTTVKDIVVRGTVTETKYCETCSIWRPPRSSHCSNCNNDVMVFDHHWFVFPLCKLSNPIIPKNRIQKPSHDHSFKSLGRKLHWTAKLQVLFTVSDLVSRSGSPVPRLGDVDVCFLGSKCWH